MEHSFRVNQVIVAVVLAAGAVPSAVAESKACETVDQRAVGKLDSPIYKHWPDQDLSEVPFGGEVADKGPIYVGIRANPRLRDGGPIKVTVRAKGDGLFETVCSALIEGRLTSIKDKYLMAEAPNARLWRVEIEVPRDRKPRPKQVLFQVLWATRRYVRADQPAATSSSHGIGTSNELARYFCARAAASETSAKPKVEFARNPILRVPVFDFSHVLTPAALTTLEEKIASTVAAWNSVCPACAPGNNTILQIGDREYLHGVLVEELDKLWQETRGHRPSREQWSGLTEKLRGNNGTGETVNYFRIETPRSSPALHMVCIAPYDIVPPVITALRSELACGTREERNKAEELGTLVPIYVLDGSTSCGSDTRIIACGVPDEKIELDARHTGFLMSPQGSWLFGSKEQVIDLGQVLIHEFGHWLGVGHLETKGNIMSASAADGECVDDAVLEAVRQALNSEKIARPEEMMPLRFK